MLCRLPVGGRQSIVISNQASSYHERGVSVVQGFQRVADNLEDTALDNPKATTEFPSIVEEAQTQGWLDPSFQVCLPRILSLYKSRFWYENFKKRPII